MSRAGVLRHDCPPAPAVGAGKDCFVYVVSGRQVVPIGGVQKLSRPASDSGSSTKTGRWQVVNYDYELLNS